MSKIIYIVMGIIAGSVALSLATTTTQNGAGYDHVDPDYGKVLGESVEEKAVIFQRRPASKAQCVVAG